MRLIFTIFIFALGAAAGYYIGSGKDISALLRRFEDVKKVAEKTVSLSKLAPTSSTSIPEAVGEIPGVWRNAEDSTFTREFRVDGTVFDRYGGKPDATTEGQWHVFTSSSDEQTPFPLEEGVTYLAIKMVEEVLYFDVRKLSDSELELVYQGGGVIRFTRVR